MDSWESFFVATMGAAAALAGLIIVAMSVNISTILKSPGLPSRAGATIGSLILVVVSAGAGLIPMLGIRGFGVVTLLVALVSTGLYVRAGISGIRSPHGSRTGRAMRVVISAAQMLPVIVGSLLAIDTYQEGVLLVAVGFLLIFAGSMLNAWVLLVEILR